MLLNQTAIYGIRAIAVLAALAPGESLTAAQLSERTGVARQYLSKVMRRLVVARLVRSQRGHGGGFSLMRPPDRITLLDALRAGDQDLDGGCAFGFGSCDPVHPCALHPIWSSLQEGMQRWASGHTFAQTTAVPRQRQHHRSPPRPRTG